MNRAAPFPVSSLPFTTGRRCRAVTDTERRRNRSSATLALICFAFASPAAAAPPQRIVSLNVCTDQILVDLVPRERIAAVTHLAVDPTISTAPEKFAQIPVSHGGAEDVLARDPDLVITGAYSTPATVDLLRRLGRRVVVVPFPQDIAGVRAVIAEIAAVVEAPEAGRALIAAFDAKIERIRNNSRATDGAPSALVYQINNYVAGRGTLIDEALEIAGFRNDAHAIRTFASGQTDLESIIAAPPDLMVLATAPDAYTTAVGDNLRHPALRQLMQRLPSVVLPWPLWLCGTQHIATAIERLSAARSALVATAPSKP